MKKEAFVILLSLVLLSACSPSVSSIQTAISQTEAAKPSLTPYPTYTQQPTFTPYPTYTPAPTQTARVIVVTPTNTLTPTLTPTPLQSPTPTQPPTNTPQAWQKTGTVVAKTNAYLDTYEKVNSKDFYTYPDKFKSKKVVVSGTIFNINGDDQFQIWLSGIREPAYIVADKPFDDLYENTYVTVYGIGQGETCGKNAYGGEVCQPLLWADFIKK